MARGYLLFVVLAGLFASLIGGSLTNEAPPLQATQHVVPKSASLDPSAVPAEATDGIALQRDGNGHFYADVVINGAHIRALVDTGASAIALTRDDARAAGVPTSIGMPEVIGDGAGGEVHGELVTLESVSLGAKEAENMPAVVLSTGEQSLLGQAFLARFETVQIKGDTMVLR
jgi:aspartyl protease family protein